MKVYIHLGIHKTGSSFLQKEFFSKYKDGSLYVGRSDLTDFKRYILYTDDFEFQPAEGLKIFETIVNRLGSCDRVVLSDEEFYGNPFVGILDRKRNIDRLIKVFGTSLYVLILIRNQQSLLNSLYNQYIKTGGTASFKKFLNHKKYPLNFNLDYLKYDKYLSYIRSRIGERKLDVYLYEEFLESKSEVLMRITHFITEKNEVELNVPNPNKRINTSLKNGNIPMMRFFNKFIKSPKEPFLFLNIIFHKTLKGVILKLNFNVFGKRNYFLTDEADIKEIGMSNLRLKEEFKGLNIEKHKYLIQKQGKN